MSPDSQKESRHIVELITAAILGLTASTLTFQRVEASPIPFHALQIVEPPKPQPLPEYAKAKAEEYGISWQKLNNLITYESRWNPSAVNGLDRGLVQINSFYNPHITDEQAYDPYWAIDWAAKEISEGREHAWTVCNCVSLVRSKLGTALPKMADIQPNSEPTVGGVAIFYYKHKETGDITKHVAYITDVFPDYIYIFEANFEPCKISTRKVMLDDPHIAGFFFPG